jgi:predicted dienelactone hydrolase
MTTHRRSLVTITLAALYLGTGPAAADGDVCLTGSSTLADQRALAALRADIDAACPCASFAPPGGGRGAYRRCLRPLLDAALDSGAVRAECARTAKLDTRIATCGTTKTACGRFDPTRADDGATCKLKPAARCTDKGDTWATPCPEQTHCSDVVGWTAGTCVDGRRPGRWRAGARTLTITTPSVVDGSPRVLETVVWYPTDDDGPVDSAIGAILDAAVSTDGAPHPLLVFSHGNCGFPAQSTFLTAQLATYGYVVVAPSHPQSLLADCLANTDSLVRSAQERQGEVDAAIDTMLAADATIGSPFAGTIDGGRIGCSGHSFGSWTTFRVAASDPRVKVAITMAGVPASPPALTVPLLAMTGLEDSIVSPEALANGYAAAGPPKALVEIEHAGHFAFSDNCIPGFPDCNPPLLTQDEAHAVVLRWVVPFLERFLRGSPRFEPFLAVPPPPGVVVEHEP